MLHANKLPVFHIDLSIYSKTLSVYASVQSPFVGSSLLSVLRLGTALGSSDCNFKLRPNELRRTQTSSPDNYLLNSSIDILHSFSAHCRILHLLNHISKSNSSSISRVPTKDALSIVRPNEEPLSGATENQYYIRRATGNSRKHNKPA